MLASIVLCDTGQEVDINWLLNSSLLVSRALTLEVNSLSLDISFSVICQDVTLLISEPIFSIFLLLESIFLILSESNILNSIAWLIGATGITFLPSQTVNLLGAFHSA